MEPHVRIGPIWVLKSPCPGALEPECGILMFIVYYTIVYYTILDYAILFSHYAVRILMFTWYFGSPCSVA